MLGYIRSNVFVYSNGTGDRDFYTDRFRYDAEKKVYICPAGKELYFARNRTSKDKGILGYEYRNYDACASCQYKVQEKISA
ncbi:hypothetical protein SPSIL_038570 [Sporomusa silvacetica DSM 10669]|uniref:Uncharacterized protein n=1 Tax=Sporomusa silvacetica DSM 10669 TaxID=1123289 RepID=A0ABZ3IQE6_9FIRM|nr:hypothetical protein [Sporomusa silvacetica]OZC13592.1 hypothetical protein SPSIL_53110 [Sporomusa silvacetica DSM 10669]